MKIEKDNLADILTFFAEKRHYSNEEFIPVVKDKESRQIIGSVRSWNILEYIDFGQEIRCSQQKECANIGSSVIS